MKYQNEHGEWGPKPSFEREEKIGDAIVLYFKHGTSPHPEGSGGQVYHLERYVYSAGGCFIARVPRWVDGGMTATSDGKAKRAHEELEDSLIDPDETGGGRVEAQDFVQ